MGDHSCVMQLGTWVPPKAWDLETQKGSGWGSQATSLSSPCRRNGLYGVACRL